jgi:sporulation protein YlmC with PRC-barrel domain
MRQKLLRTIVACAAGLTLGAQAQTSPGSAGGSATDPSSSSSSSQSTSPSTAPGSYGGTSTSQSGAAGRHLSATGRMGHEAIRGSQLIGAQVTGSSGSQVGTISDTIINPVSGRVEFAVLSVASAGSSTGSASSGTSTSTGISSSTSSSAGGKQVAVPWALLRSSSQGGSASATSSSTSLQQPSFVFSGDNTKLESAPSFDASTDLNQPSWRQSVFSYFGVSGNSSATGGAETPGASSSGTSSQDLNPSTGR